jgi:SAM-dependent methyltransferase
MRSGMDFVQKRESTVTTYSELAQTQGGGIPAKDRWGTAEYGGKFVVVYSDPDLTRDVFTTRMIGNFRARGLSEKDAIKIADFGGGDGVLLDTLTRQLTDKGYLDVTGVNFDVNAQHLGTMKSKFSSENVGLGRNLHAVRAGVTNLPLPFGSIDAGCSRFVVQYLNPIIQGVAIQEMFATLKPGAELIIQWPRASTTSSEAVVLDDFDANIDAILTDVPVDEVKGNRHLLSIEEMRDIADKIGASHEIGLIDGCKMYISAEAYIDRFNVTDVSKIEHLKALFNDAFFKQRLRDIPSVELSEENNRTYIAFTIGIAALSRPV